MSGDIVEFPGCADPEGYSEDQIDRLHSEAFRALESSISDCATMAKIAAQYMSKAQCQDEMLAFSVFHLQKMLKSLYEEYRARWHGERRD